MRRHCSLVVWVLLLGACGGGGGDSNTNLNGNQNTAPCPQGYAQSGPACIPVFDDCPGPAEIPVLGGGCQAVGVTTCATGLFEPDGAGGCEPILPPGPDPCPPGTMEVLGRTECQPVGVTVCAAGFEPDGEGGCDAVLPPAPCPPGTIALLGHTTCQPLGDCGVGAWGNIVDDGTTVYVDQTADATAADGTAQAPFVTIGEAMAVALSGGQIAIAAGEYSEYLEIHDPLRLTGRCAELVTIRGIVFWGAPRSPVLVAAGGSDSVVQGVTLTGPAEGLVVLGAQQVVLREIQVLDASDLGVLALDGAEVSLQRVVVAGCAYLGIYSYGSTLDMQDSVIRDTRPQPGTQLFGRGINAQCASATACGSLRVASSLLSGNRSHGIMAFAVDTEVTATVVRDTLPQESDGMSGQGIAAECEPAFGICGSLLVSGSLISGNRDIGIAAEGVATEVTATVVRDTLPREDDGIDGRGINAQCKPEVGACGSLLVSSSLLSGNRNAGIMAFGVDTGVTATVVRDTLPQESDGKSGRGIVAECDSAFGVCGSLQVSSSLISGNRDSGIAAFGVDTEITATVVRDTLSRESDWWFGVGIMAQCTPAGICGSLRVFSSLISGNREEGIAAVGVDTEVTATVVRDTLAQESSGISGRGIHAQCEPVSGECGSLRVSSSLIAGNRDVGIAVEGVETEVTATVVRDTLPLEADGMSGRGINAQCSMQRTCGSLAVSSCLVSGNREMGIIAFGVDTEVTGSVVRDTVSQEGDGLFGRGISAECDLMVGFCGGLWVSSSLVSGNQDVGITAIGVVTEVTGSVVRDTLAQEADGINGRGINAQCEPVFEECGSLRLASSLVVSSEDVGVYLGGVPATLEGVAVIDTRANTAGPYQGIHGQGIWATCDGRIGACGKLSMSSSLVESCQGAGLAVRGTSGFIASSVVRSVEAQALDGKYGYGIQIGGLEGEEMPTFNVTDCEIRDARLAGILYYRAQGTLARSVVSGGENSVVMNEGSEPTILDSNDLSGSVENEPVWANLFPCPSPPPSLPSDPIATE